MPKIKLNDINLYYEIHGEGEPIVLIGGFSCDRTIWNEVVKHLINDYQIILLDNRGAGQTDVPNGPYSIDQMANDVVALCAKIGIKQAHFVGNSMGGYIVQTLAHQHPDLVKSAVISNSTMSTQCCFHVYVAAQLELLKAQAPLRALIHASCAWAFSFHFLTQPGVLDQLIQIGLDNPYPFTIPGYEGQYAALDQFNSTTWANQIKVPVLVIGSDQDLIFNERLVKSLAAQIPHAEYVSFTECGHLPPVEQPEKFANVTKTFVASHS